MIEAQNKTGGIENPLPKNVGDEILQKLVNDGEKFLQNAAGKAAKEISKKKEELAERLEVLTSVHPGKTQKQKEAEAVHKELSDYVKDLEARMVNMKPIAQKIAAQNIESANAALS